MLAPPATTLRGPLGRAHSMCSDTCLPERTPSAKQQATAPPSSTGATAVQARAHEWRRWRWHGERGCPTAHTEPPGKRGPGNPRNSPGVLGRETRRLRMSAGCMGVLVLRPPRCQTTPAGTGVSPERQGHSRQIPPQRLVQRQTPPTATEPPAWCCPHGIGAGLRPPGCCSHPPLQARPLPLRV